MKKYVLSEKAEHLGHRSWSPLPRVGISAICRYFKPTTKSEIGG